MQPVSPPGQWNRMEHRALEGFVLAISPFNFTSIGGNLAGAPAIMGNTVVWKPATTALLAAQVIMEIFEAAGMPPGVINMIAGPGAAVSEAAVKPPIARRHPFHRIDGHLSDLWTNVAANLGGYRTYPRLVGETGGKDFVLAHPSASVDALLVGLLRGSFEYQGQKCSASSRAYIPQSVWERLREPLAAATEAIPVGDPAEFNTFMGAVIDEPSFRKHEAVLTAARTDPDLSWSPAASATRTSAGSCTRRSMPARTRSTISSNASSSGRSSPCTRIPTGVALGDRPGRPHLAIRADRSRLRRGPACDRRGVEHACATRPATSISMTSRRAQWSDSSHSVALV